MTAERFAHIGWQLAAACLLLVAFFIIPFGEDAFRGPKLYAAIGASIVLAGVLLIGLTNGWLRVSRKELLEARTVIPVAIVLWSVIGYFISVNRAVSASSIGWVAAMAIFFWATSILAERNPRTSIAAVLIAGSVNAAIYAAQELKIWNPLTPDPDFATKNVHLFSTALIGNPNDAACFFLPIALVAVILVTQSRRKTIPVAAALLLGAVILAGQTLTAIVAYIAGLFTIGMMRSRRIALIAAAAAVFALMIVGSAYEPMRDRMGRLFDGVVDRRVDEILSGRTTAFLATTEMIARHPLIGNGPGTFHWLYFPEKTDVEEKYPRYHLLDSWTRPLMFGEAHSDHLQILAEAGVVGYALFIGSLVALGSISFRSRHLFARAFALPFAVSVAVVTLAQFPLQLAATTVLYLHAAAICFAWQKS